MDQINFQSKDEALREACSIGNTDLVKQLIKDGNVDINSKNKMNGWTGLHWAVKRGHESIVTFLLQHGADPSIQNDKGDSASVLAANERIVDILRTADPYSVKDIPRKVGSNGEKKTADPSSVEGSEFVPNYLKHPVFPHTQQSGFVKTEPVKPVPPVTNPLPPHMSQRTSNRPTNVDEGELVLKVRQCGDEDFIEVELDIEELTFENLLDVCCRELEVSRDVVVKVRKLPNTLLRKDKDVRRLKQFQEIELVL